MTVQQDEPCCLPTELCRECLAYYAWLNRDLDREKPLQGDDIPDALRGPPARE
jgi:hypothetical protein